MWTQKGSFEIPVLLTWREIGGFKRRPGRRIETAELQMTFWNWSATGTAVELWPPNATWHFWNKTAVWNGGQAAESNRRILPFLPNDRFAPRCSPFAAFRPKSPDFFILPPRMQKYLYNQHRAINFVNLLESQSKVSEIGGKFLYI